MTGVNLARSERLAMVASMREAGPDAPTLCEGWTTRDLAVHLLLRERRLDATAGMFLSPLAGHTANVTEATLARGWDDLLTDIEDGPPWYSPFKPADRYVNLGEMFVHHEDVLRGGADPNGPWSPRELSPELEKALRLPLRTVGRITMSGSPGRVRFRTPDGATLLTIGRGPDVTVTGRTGELVLFAFGRAPADVEITGDADVVAKLLRAKRTL